MPLWVRVDPIKLIIVFLPIRKPPRYLTNIEVLSTSQEVAFIYTFTGMLAYKYKEDRQISTPSCMHFTKDYSRRRITPEKLYGEIVNSLKSTVILQEDASFEVHCKPI